jgi:chromosomal replication initiator protein
MDLWEQVKVRLSRSVSVEGFENWVSKTKLLRIDHRTAAIGVPNEATKLWMEQEYAVHVVAALEELRLPLTGVAYEVLNAASQSGLAINPAEPMNGLQLNPKLTFENFVVGSSNQFAHAAALAVSRTPARTYNPLFLYGPAGLGKTHLMHAIGRALTDRYSRLRIIYTTSEKFMNQMIQSIKSDRMPQFQEYYRSADVLLVDDIQHIGGKERTQEEFFHTFNELHESEKQIVISSDSPPKHTPGLADRLKSRFEWGLTVDIHPPDLETKMAILDKKAESEGLSLPEDVRIFIATKTKANVRELEGALVKLMAFSEVTREPVSMGMAQQVLKYLTQASDRRITIDSVIKAVAEKFSLLPAQLKMKSNERKIAYPRQIAMYLAKELTHSSLPEIGRAFGGKHHTTVLHSIQKIEALREKDADLNKLIHSLSDSLTV